MIHRSQQFHQEQAERSVAQWVSTTMVLVHIGLGVSIVAGGSHRFSRPSYTPLIEIVHGHTWIWGLALLLSGTLMVIPNIWTNMAGLWIGMAWMIMWTACFTISASIYPTAVTTAMVAYAGLGAIDAILLTAKIFEMRFTARARVEAQAQSGS